MDIWKRLFLPAQVSTAVLAAALLLYAEPLQHDAIGYSQECVVLLHGLARTSASMARLGDALADADFGVANIDYPSREYPIEELAPMAIEKGIQECRSQRSRLIHFVTHSLGGILVRYYLADHQLPELGRVVMLGPPNKGSEVVDELSAVPGFTLWNGPSGLQLGTDKDSVPRQLGPPQFELGIIAGTRSINPIFSRFLPDLDDGLVSVESTKLERMQDFLTLPHTHTFMMRSADVIRQTIFFLHNGRFDKTDRAGN